MAGSCYAGVWKGKFKGKPDNAGLPGRMTVKLACDIVECMCVSLFVLVRRL